MMHLIVYVDCYVLFKYDYRKLRDFFSTNGFAFEYKNSVTNTWSRSDNDISTKHLIDTISENYENDLDEFGWAVRYYKEYDDKKLTVFHLTEDMRRINAIICNIQNNKTFYSFSVYGN